MRKSFSRLLFHLEAVRLPPSYLVQRRFTANFNSDDDYVKFPSRSIFPGSSLAGLQVCPLALSLVSLHYNHDYKYFQCVDVHYIELVEDRLLLEPTLNSKVSRHDHCIILHQQAYAYCYCVHDYFCCFPHCRYCLLAFVASHRRLRVL